jgi:hypothetical protein
MNDASKKLERTRVRGFGGAFWVVKAQKAG